MAPVASPADQAALDGKCPSCGQPGHVISQHVSAPASLRGFGRATIPMDCEQDWVCAPCAIEWRTCEDYGCPQTRRLIHVYQRHTLTPRASSPVYALNPAPEPEPPKEPAPERTIQGSVIGYRAWRIVDWQLYGTGVNRAWVPGVNEATCDAGRSYLYGMSSGYGHPAPAMGCHCGITALARFTQSDEHWSGADVFGAIEAWGEDGQVERAEPGDVAEAVGVELHAPPVVTPSDVVSDLLADYKHAGLDQGMAPPESSRGFILHRNGFRARYGKVVLLAVDEDWPAAKTAAVRALAREHGADVCRREHLEDAAKEHGQLVDEELLEWVAKDEPSPFENLSANVKTIAGMMNVPLSLLTPSPAVWSFSTAHPYPITSYPNAGKGAHQRWHVNRGIVKDDCPYCAEADD